VFGDRFPIVWVRGRLARSRHPDSETSMFHVARHFRNALQPLVTCALDLNVTERQAWLQELRIDCPTVARELAQLLGAPLESTAHGGAADGANTVLPGSPEHLGLRR